MLIKNGGAQLSNLTTLRSVSGVLTTETLSIDSTRKVCEAVDDGLGGWDPNQNTHLGFTDYEFTHSDGSCSKEYRVNAQLVLKWNPTQAPWQPRPAGAAIPAVDPVASATQPVSPVEPIVTPPPTPPVPTEPTLDPAASQPSPTQPSEDVPPPGAAKTPAVAAWKFEGTLDTAPEWIVARMSDWPNPGAIAFESEADGSPALLRVVMPPSQAGMSPAAIVLRAGDGHNVVQGADGSIYVATPDDLGSLFEFPAVTDDWGS